MKGWKCILRCSLQFAGHQLWALHCGHAHAWCRYGAEAGLGELRELIATKLYPGGQVKASEIFVSDGSKCDIGRLQMMFGNGITVSAQVCD